MVTNTVCIFFTFAVWSVTAFTVIGENLGVQCKKPFKLPKTYFKLNICLTFSDTAYRMRVEKFSFINNYIGLR